MGGRIAEEIIFGKQHITPGASSDIRVATKYAKSMVMHWGMSDQIGPVFHNYSNSYSMYIDDEGMHSEHTAKTIDTEVKKIISQAYADAKDILTNHIDKLHLIAKELIEQETLTGKQV